MRDHIQDKNLSDLNHVLNVFEFPAFAKEASVANTDAVAHLSAEMFADPRRRLYPIHTKADTWLSTAYFYKNASQYSEGDKVKVAERLVDAARFWKLENTFKNITTPPELEKTATEHSVLTVEFRQNGTVEAQVHIRNQQDLEKVAAELIQDRHRFPYEMRRDVARQLLAAGTFADDYVRDHLEKTAGYVRTDVQSLKDAVRHREALYKRAYRQVPSLDELHAICKEAEEKAEAGLVQDTFLEKIAGILDNYDRFARLHTSGYGSSLSAPEDSFGGITRNGARTIIGGVVDIGGRLYPKHQVLKHAKELQQLFADLAGEYDLTDEQILQKAASACDPLLVQLFTRVLGA